MSTHPSSLSPYLSVCVARGNKGPCVNTLLLSYSFDVTFQVVAFISSNNNNKAYHRCWWLLLQYVPCIASLREPMDFYWIGRLDAVMVVHHSSIGIRSNPPHTSLCSCCCSHIDLLGTQLPETELEKEALTGIGKGADGWLWWRIHLSLSLSLSLSLVLPSPLSSLLLWPLDVSDEFTWTDCWCNVGS